MTERSATVTTNPSRPFIVVSPGCDQAGLCLAPYMHTLVPGVLGSDVGELQFVPPILSLAHPTGYPLQTLLSKLWATLAPLGSVAYRLNLLSAVAGTAAVGSVYANVYRPTRSWPAALLASLLLGASAIFWDQARFANKYALTALLMALRLTLRQTYPALRTAHQDGGPLAESGSILR